ncbi:hypothetical protein [Actinoplanes italicus]|nr:hypothetical protein [Actinoplanes italicus]
MGDHVRGSGIEAPEQLRGVPGVVGDGEPVRHGAVGVTGADLADHPKTPQFRVGGQWREQTASPPTSEPPESEYVRGGFVMMKPPEVGAPVPVQADLDAIIGL